MESSKTILEKASFSMLEEHGENHKFLEIKFELNNNLKKKTKWL